MNAYELLSLAEIRLLALDEEVRANGTYLERALVVDEFRELAEAKIRLDLLETQRADLVRTMTRNGVSHDVPPRFT